MTAEQILTLIGIVLGSSGLWTLVTKLIDRKGNKMEALKASIEELGKEVKGIKADIEKVASGTKGALYDRCKYVGEQYIKRGWISVSELADYNKYLYEPYKTLGGDGTIDSLHSSILELPIEITGGKK